MIVSLLQLMGFAVGKPIQSRAGEVQGASAPEHASASAHPARRHAVNTSQAEKPATKPAATATKSAAATAPAKSKAAPAKPIKAATPPDKVVSAAKATGKPVAKTAPSKAPPQVAAPAAAKPAHSPAPKVAVKPVIESAPKTVSKPAAAVKAAPAAAPRPTSAVPLTQPPARVSRGKAGPLTAPSMPPAVASTAAKSSYTMTSSPRTETFVPPPFVAAKKDAKLANNWKTKPVDQLTDAELMAMPDSEYMNDKQMAFFRLKLAQLKKDILDNAGETTEHLREDTVIVPDPADRATIEEEHALELRTRDRERKLLKKIEQSITRIDTGDYGYCDETGEPIGVGRLLARPTATLSLEAQQRRELKQKMFGD
jgi:DnaK suppressor protein